MKIQLKKWGNSVGLRLPKVLLAQLGIAADQPVELTIEDNVLKITKPAVTLDDLVQQITADNRHAEVQWHDSVGKEVW